MNKWLKLVRANFLLLTPIVLIPGWTAAYYDGYMLNTVHILLTLIGCLLAHISVNVFNNYFDYVKGIDFKTFKTPFSGGVDTLVNGELKPKHAYITGLLSLTGAVIIGVYFIYIYPVVLLLVVLGMVSIYFYTQYISRIPVLSEFVVGLNFGLMPLGAYIVLTGRISPTTIAVFIPVSILVGILLYLNEFPDIEIDREAGRRHAVVILGLEKASKLYIVLLTLTYTTILVSVALRILPATCLIALASTPLAYKAVRIVLVKHNTIHELIPALALNVQIVLATPLLIAIGLIIATLIGVM